MLNFSIWQNIPNPILRCQLTGPEKRIKSPVLALFILQVMKIQRLNFVHATPALIEASTQPKLSIFVLMNSIFVFEKIHLKIWTLKKLVKMKKERRQFFFRGSPRGEASFPTGLYCTLIQTWRFSTFEMKSANYGDFVCCSFPFHWHRQMGNVSFCRL